MQVMRNLNSYLETCGCSITGKVPAWNGASSPKVKDVPGDWTLMIFKCPFHPKPFYDSKFLLILILLTQVVKDCVVIQMKTNRLVEAAKSGTSKFCQNWILGILEQSSCSFSGRTLHGCYNDVLKCAFQCSTVFFAPLMRPSF